MVSFGLSSNSLAFNAFTLEDISEPEVMNVFWMLRGVAYEFKFLIFVDSISVFFCAAQILMLLRDVIKAFDKMLNNLQSAAGILVTFLFSITFTIYGISMFNMSIYGIYLENYHDALTSFLYTLY